MPKIYISSTYEDLKEYREAVSHALRKIKADAIAMEDYVAQDQRPLQNCLDDVASSDIYVGIFAWRYGYIPYDNNNDTNPNNLSITELEYRKAQEKGIPCLIFLLDESVPWPLKFSDGTPQSGTSGDDINRLRNELKKNHSISYFKSPYELASNVLAAINSRDIKSQVNVDKLYRNKEFKLQLSNLISGTEVRSISKHTASESANKNLKEPKINKDISAYKEFKLQYQSYMNSDDISVTDVWTKGLRPLIAQFDPNKYNNLNEYSKSRINSLSTLLRRSFKELANTKGINNQDVKEIEDSIDKYLQEISKLYETIFEADLQKEPSKEPTVEEPEARMEDRSSITKRQDIGHDILPNNDKSALEYSFVLRRNIDVSITLINHIIHVIDLYLDDNNSEKNNSKSQDSRLFNIIRKELNRYHNERCSYWLRLYNLSVVPPLYDEEIKKVVKTSIGEIFENLHKKIFDEYEKIDKVEDLNKFKEYCNNIIKPDLETLLILSNIMFKKEGITLNY